MCQPQEDEYDLMDSRGDAFLKYLPLNTRENNVFGLFINLQNCLFINLQNCFQSIAVLKSVKSLNPRPSLLISKKILISAKPYMSFCYICLAHVLLRSNCWVLFPTILVILIQTLVSLQGETTITKLIVSYAFLLLLASSCGCLYWKLKTEQEFPQIRTTNIYQASDSVPVYPGFIFDLNQRYISILYILNYLIYLFLDIFKYFRVPIMFKYYRCQI